LATAFEIDCLSWDIGLDSIMFMDMLTDNAGGVP
jgi:hypothetical protein